MPRRVIEDCPSLDGSFFDDEALPPGIVFTDVQLKKWRIGKPIGRGSFGRIYLASNDVKKEVTKQNARYVVKIEPYTNGPLFVEIHCMIRTAQVSKVKAWRQQNKLKRLGMPLYIANGSFVDEITGTKYRFLVLPRYDIDLQKIIARTRILDLKNVLVLSLQILDVLEYLHNQGYTHSDIKSSNLMLGFDCTKFVKPSPLKPSPSFQKERQVVLLPGKHRKAKTGRSRPSNYYDDEDFTVTQKTCNGGDNIDGDDRLTNVKKNLGKILSDRENRTLHRHHAFNLRQLSNYVNYEDLGSVCSDRSYQKLDDNSKKLCISEKIDFEMDLDTKHKEAVMSQSNGQIYLLDYGLASKFLDSDGNHKEFVMDARKAHDGTLEYSSRDSHVGAHSRRSDLETLGYNILDWLTGRLPWKTKEVLAAPDLVHALKKNFMSDIKFLLKTCFKTEFYPQFIEKYLQYITSLDYMERPDYDFCRSLFRSELLKNGFLFDKELNLNFAEPTTSPMSRNKLCYPKRFGRKNTPPDFVARNGIKKSYERENVCSLENDLKLELLKQSLNTSSDGMRKPCTSRNFFISDADLISRLKKSLMPLDMLGKKLSPKNLRSKKKNITKHRGKARPRNNVGKFGNLMGSARQFTWAEILAGNPEDIIRKERHPIKKECKDEEDDLTCKYKIRKLSNASYESYNDANIQSPLMQKDYLQNLNPTYAMKEVLSNFKRKVTGKTAKEPEERPPGLEGYTPAMIRLYKLKEKREANDRLNLVNQDIEQTELDQPMRCTRSLSKFATGNHTVAKPLRKTTNDNDRTTIFCAEAIVVPPNESNNHIRTRRVKSCVNRNENKIVVQNKLPSTTKTSVQLRTRKARSVIKNVTEYTSDNDQINISCPMPALDDSCDQIKTRGGRCVAKNNNKITITPINTEVEPIDTTNSEIKTRRIRSVPNKSEKRTHFSDNDGQVKASDNVLDIKNNNQINTRVTRSKRSKKDLEIKQSIMEPSKPKKKTSTVLPNRRRLRSSKRKKT
ncbi:uncharacterized protein [Battus philenor]|uniref:uncharacterized protein n=1 Tax=Battus philenor TaxID=42288 RepID=UPI0035CED900